MYQQYMENVDLEIKWSDPWKLNRGQMLVHLNEFIGDKNITKFRKLLKIIRDSNTPDEEIKMREWCEQIPEQAEQFKKMAILRKYEKAEQIRKIETEIDLLKCRRDRYKKKYTTIQRPVKATEKGKGKPVSRKSKLQAGGSGHKRGRQ